MEASVTIMQANIININGNPIEQIIYKKQPVITLRMMDELHERKEGTAKRNFYQNNDKLIEGKHFFSVPYDEWSKISEVRNSYCSKNHNQMTFLTLKGYLLLVKSFTDELAWQIQDEMVDVYFQTRQAKKEVDPLTEKLNQLEKLRKIQSVISPQEFNRLRLAALGEYADEIPVIIETKPLFQLLELVLHAQKVGRHFQGVDVILYDEPVIQFSTSELKNAFDALAKENCLMQPYKSSSSLSAAIRGMLQNSKWIYEGEIKRTAHNRIYQLVKKQ